MTRLFRSKSCGLVGLTEFHPPSPVFHSEEEEEDDDEDGEEYGDRALMNPISTPFISPAARFGAGNERGRHGSGDSNHHQLAILDMLVAALRKSLVTCSVEREDVSSMDISWPTEVRHVSHVTFDRFDGFLGLPTELQPEVPRKVPSASANVFGVSAKSMQCSYDDRGNSVPTILLMMQKRLYVEGGLKAEGIFRINAENSHEEYVRNELNKGVVPRGIDVHCLAGLIKAWFRELPSGVLDSLTAEQVMHCNTEDDCIQLVKLLPPTESALLDWAINLMADVVEHEQYNKMNARNIAMVFAPNMTQMADPLTALIHAVQVMNLLKTLILKTIRQREESTAMVRLQSACLDSATHKSEPHDLSSYRQEFCEKSQDTCAAEAPSTGNFLYIDTSIAKMPSTGTFLGSATMDRLECSNQDRYWSFQKKRDGDEEFESSCEMGASEEGCKESYENGDWLSLRKGMRKLCRHPVFQLSKPAKKSRDLGVINNGESREAWA